MDIISLIELLGGVGLFLYGMSLMGSSLERLAGSGLEGILGRLTTGKHKGAGLVKGWGLGTIVTAIIQSSAATTMMLIGFVNAGIMRFEQSIPVVFGANVGSTVTAQILRLGDIDSDNPVLNLLKPRVFAPMLVAIGAIIFLFCKKKKLKSAAGLLIGLGTLFYGMTQMEEVFEPLRESESFHKLFVSFENPLVGIIIGLLVTAIIQSSSASVGILQALSMTGALSFSAAFPILLGIAVGGALPVLLSAMGASVNARRTALVHLIIDVLGAVICGVVFYAANAVRPISFMDAAMTPVTVALANTVFRIVTVILLTPAIGLMGKLACLLIKDAPEPKANHDFELLEERFVQHPSLAIEQCRIVLASMAEHTRENIADALSLLRGYSEEVFRRVQETEELVDQYEDRLGSYIVQVSSAELTKQQNEDVYEILHAITDLERISDHASNIAENAREIYEKNIPIEADLAEEMAVMEAALAEVLALSIRALTAKDAEAAHHVEPLEERIDQLCEAMKRRQIDRLTRGVYSRQNSFVFNELIGNYERVSDHCSNIALSVIELEQESFDGHSYIEGLKRRSDEEFERYYRGYREKYSFDRL